MLIQGRTPANGLGRVASVAIVSLTDRANRGHDDKTGALASSRPESAREAGPMLRTLRFNTLTVASALVLSATACTGSDGGGGAADGGSPTTGVASASTAARVLPASLASNKGWLAYSTFIGEQDRIHLVRVDGSGDRQIVPDLPGDII